MVQMRIPKLYGFKPSLHDQRKLQPLRAALLLEMADLNTIDDSSKR